MKFNAFAALVLGAATKFAIATTDPTSTSSTSNTGIHSELPVVILSPCVVTCINTTTQEIPQCGNHNVDCLCNNNQFKQIFSDCVKRSNCTAADLAAAALDYKACASLYPTVSPSSSSTSVSLAASSSVALIAPSSSNAASVMKGSLGPGFGSTVGIGFALVGVAAGAIFVL